VTRPPSRFRPEAATALRAEIDAHGGAEIMAIGEVDAEGCVCAVEVHARGTDDQVLVLLRRPQAGQVVIHNHPSGVLQPSEADLSIGGRLGEDGVGSVIVNNAVTASTWFVEPHAPKAVHIEAAEVEGWFRGRLPAVLDGHEPRPGQLAMAEAVRVALNEGQLATLEAGTGTGKSLAYLVPAALWALQNRGKVAIATFTLTLQSQLATSDLPVLDRAGVGVKSAVLKGRSNYLCRRRLEEAQHEPDLSPADRAALAALARFAEGSAEGTRQELGAAVDDDLWERVESDHDQTLRARCPHFGRCFYYQARRQAAEAQLLVINHSLLLADRVIKSESGGEGLLPLYDRVIIDEAHHLEDAATSLLQAGLGARSLGRAVQRLVPGRRGPGALARLRARFLAKGSPLHPEDQRRFDRDSELLSRLLPRVDQAVHDALELCAAELLPEGQDSRRIDGALRATATWIDLLEPALREAGHRLAQAAALSGQLLDLLDELPPQQRFAEPQPVFDLGRARKRLTELAGSTSRMLADDPDSVRWVGRPRGRRQGAALAVAPIDVGEALRTHLFRPLKAAVLTSATLTVNGHFDHFLGRVGLRAPAAPDAEDAPTARGGPAAHQPGVPALRFEQKTLQLGVFPSPFDYARQALLGLPRDLPPPDQPGWLDAAAQATAEAIEISGGGVFVLCTSHEAVGQLHARCTAALGDRMLLLRQGQMGRDRLLETFRAHGDAVLFGTDSFWEGVSVRGEALRLVIIPKLPFRVPTEPIQQARYERVEAMGLDPFRTFTLPAAVLRLRQGFGRLVRSAADRGAVLILDRRVHERWYGRVFLRSLPEMERATGPTRAVLDRVRAFFRASAPLGPTGRGAGPPVP